MKTLKYLGLFLVLSLLITGCKEAADPEAEAKLKEAGELHDASLALGKEVSDMLATTDVLIAQVEAIVPTIEDEMTQQDADAHITSISEAKNDYNLWKETLVEVPGHEHAHTGEAHNHDHSMDNKPPAEILAKQKELNEYIADIKNRLTKAIEMAQAVVEEHGETPVN
ncbi:MAG: hypothetical protein HC803_03050 [Saprospiraceae bacterium]|nr:hypothetical protein [Saprospiraceae bacterium]